MIESNSEEASRVVTGIGRDTDDFENVLRPSQLDEYVGQKSLKQNLKVAIEAAKMRKEPLDHVLFHGGPGLGKTTLANVVAREMAVNIRVTSGPVLEKQGDLAAILSNLEEGDVWFIDEIHRLKPQIEEVLYSAMEDFKLDIVIGKGPSARTMTLSLPRFTLIGATTKISMLSSPLRDRFGSVLKLSFYDEDEIAQIVTRSAGILGCEIDSESANVLSLACRGTPRVANRLLKRVRDYAEVFNEKSINSKVLEKCLKMLGIDSMGLDKRDREILLTIRDKFSGGPVGLSTISAALSEDKATIEDVYEPFLIKLGFLERSHRGRKLTNLAYEYLKIN